VRQKLVIFSTGKVSGKIRYASYIRFPDEETMQRIVDVHFPGAA
jgi:hypothetical protein